MEIKDFKRIISIYDNYTINEVIKAIKEAREEIEKFNQKESEIRKEKNAKGKEISAEEKEEYNVKIQQLKEERKPTKDYLSKLERKKKGLLTRLDKKIKEIEAKNLDMQKEIESAKEIINANEKIAEDFGVEFTGLEEEMQELKYAVFIRETKINKNVEKLNKLYRIFSDVENENVLEGLQQNVVRTYKNLPKDQIFKNSRESVISIVEEERTAPEIEADDEDLEIDEDQQQEIEQQESKIEIDEQIQNLEDEIRKSAARMKEYREAGNYNQEALEHAYYNSLVSKMNDLKNKEKETKKLAEPIKTQPEKTKQPTETVKTQTIQVKQPTETVKAQTIQAKQPTETVKAQTIQAKQPTETVKTQTIQAKQPTETVKTQTIQVKQPTETVKAQTIQAKQPIETVKTEVDKVLLKYRNDGFDKNAFGWYFNPWKDEFDKEYDPHNDPEYNEKLKAEKTDKVDRTSGNIEVPEKKETEEKAIKSSLFQRLKNAIKKFIDNAKRYINNFNNKQLPEGTETEQEKEEYVAKANEILKETLSTDRVYDAKSRAVMQGREEFLAGIHISKELREKIDAQEDVKEEMSEKEEAER